MAWETRKGSSGRYYTRTYREYGRRVHEYIGTGEKARQIADGDAARRTAERERQERILAARAPYQAADEALKVYCLAVDAQMKATLHTAGFHQHDRGEWRRRRGSTAHSDRV